MESDSIKVLGFKLDTQWFALELSLVKEVVEWTTLTDIPRAPECALGVFNYHGRVITVVEPKYFFELPTRNVCPDTRIVILSGEDFRLGFRVDQADKIENLTREAIQIGREGVKEKSFIKAVVRSEDRLYNILDPEPLLDSIEEEFSAVNAR